MKQNCVIIGLCNPKSPSNAGAVLRAAGCYDASSIRYTGNRLTHGLKYHTDTKNAQSNIPLSPVDDLLQDLPADMKVVCVELVEGATALPQFEHPKQALYVFGAEDASIPQEVVDKADEVVFVPTKGCMNLAATVNVLLYDRLAKAGWQADERALIKASRDTNNRLKVKGAN